MSEKLEWLFKLSDELTGNSRKMAAALKSVEGELDAVDKGLKKIENEARRRKLEKTTDPLKRQRLELQLQRDKLMSSREATKAAGDESKKLADTMGLAALKGGIWGAVISKGIDLALGLATSVARAVVSLTELGIGFARAGLEAASFRRQMRLGFEIATGSKGKAAFEMRDAAILSEGLSASGDATQKRFLSLLQGGFTGAESHVLMQAVEDMAAGGQGDKADNIVLAIKQIRAKGRLQAEELVSQLADAGLNIGTVYEKIGKQIGTDSKGAMKAISKGEVSSAIGIYAIVDTIRETFSKDGIIGQTAKEMSDDSMKLLGMLEERPRTLMEELEGNKGAKAFSGFLQNLLKATDPQGPTGKKIVGRLNDIFERAGKALFGDLSTEEGFGKVEKFLNTAVGIVDRLIAGARVFYGFLTGMVQGMGLGQLFDDASALFDGPMDEKKIQRMTESFQSLGISLGTLIKPMVQLVDLAAKMADYATFFEKGTTGTNTLTQLGLHAIGLGPVGEAFANANNAGLGGQVAASFRPQTSAVRSLTRSVHVEMGGLHLTVPEGTDGAAVLNHLNAALPGVIADMFEKVARDQGAL